MAKTTTTPTGRASLCALGAYLRRRGFCAPLREQVKIAQKTVKYRPIDKVLDGLLGILCGATTLSPSNVTIRVDPAVQRACGRQSCAEQSTIARTLQASTAETVDQLSRVSWYYRKRSGQTPPQRFAERRLWVDVDITPLPIGAHAARRRQRAPGWDASAARPGAKSCGGRRVTTEKFSMRRCCGGKRRRCRH